MRIDDLTRLQTAAELLNFVITLEMSGGVAVAGGGGGGGKSWIIYEKHSKPLCKHQQHTERESGAKEWGKTLPPMTIAKFNLSDQKNCEISFVQHVFSKWSNRIWETQEEEEVGKAASGKNKYFHSIRLQFGFRCHRSATICFLFAQMNPHEIFTPLLKRRFVECLLLSECFCRRFGV